MNRFLVITLLAAFFVACSNDNECTDCENIPESDTLTVVEDNLESAMLKDTAITVSKDQKENHDKIVKKYGEQWDFCKCIVANDSISDAFEKTLTPAQEKKLMARWDYVDIKCKELTTTPNTTPEERALHDKKVIKCLKENGLKK